MPLETLLRKINNVNVDSKCNKTLVLDLDETLVHIFEEDEYKNFIDIIKDPKNLHIKKDTINIKVNDLVKDVGKGRVYNLFGVLRPNLKKFLEYCLKRFYKVIIWSAGKYRYVNSIVKVIFNNIGSPDAIFSYDDVLITDKGINKPLDKIIEYFDDPLITRESIIIIDDREDYISDKDKNNHILIEEYVPIADVDSFYDDDELSRLIKLFDDDNFICSNDVRNLL